MEIIKLLLILGVRIDVDVNGMTPLMVASVEGHLDIQGVPKKRVILRSGLLTKVG